MTEIYLKAFKCPICGSDANHYDRECKNCSATLIEIITEKAPSPKNIDVKMLDSAMEKWRNILKQEPDNAEANYALGLVYLNKQLRDAAIHHLRKASILVPEIAVIHYNLGVTLFGDESLLLTSQEYIDAKKEIDYAVDLDPTFPEAVGMKHLFLAMKLINSEPQEAIKEYKFVIAAFPDIAIFYSNLAVCYTAIKDYDNAKKSCLKAIEMNPTESLFYANLSSFFIRVKNYQDGLIYAKKALELLTPLTREDVKAQVYDTLGLCLYNTGQKEEAIKNIEKAIALNPKNPSYIKHLVMMGKIPVKLPQSSGCSSVLVLCFLLIFLIYLLT